MSEKVLGLKCGVGREDFIRSTFKGAVVPVVSVEWLEKFCKKHGTDMWYEVSTIQVSELLDGVRLQVEAKKKVERE